MAKSKEKLAYVPRLFWNAEETAARLNVSVPALHELRKIPLYRNDSEKPGKGREKSLPLWSEELLQHIAFCRRKNEQGIRQFDDDEGYQIWVGLNEQHRQNLLRKAELV